ncbi:class C sortase [Propionicicella superfundia]|uniref:class C sortase n=1 Tax=Propionicicella superfundia TaxID=348582 RepID=UPI001FDFEE05|nr:class C sortase [Propionicicella superfundia]
MGRWSLLRTVIVLVAILGAGVLVYPTAAQWFSQADQAAELSGYVHRVAELPAAEKQAMLAEAREYNSQLPAGPLRDPYGAGGDPTRQAADRYEAVLNPDNSGQMAILSIPDVGAYLPVFHYSDPETLDKGVGHLFGSGLPVGGPSTHAVLTAHSGLVARTLFTNLNQLELGDTFTIRVLDDVLTYQVDQILTVAPDDLEALQQVPGGDYVTLVTCTPTGINTHRLLVRGVRIPTPEVVTPDGGMGGVPGPGFPWWSFALPAAGLLAAVLTRPRSAA